MVTVSVVIPVYNVKQYLERCLDSVLRQTIPFDKIIIVDDGSTDGCGEICESYALKNDRIQLIHKENGGLVSAWMAGLKYVNTSHICFIDSDDFVADDYLECLLNALDDDVDLVSMQCMRYVDEKHKVPQRYNSLPAGIHTVDDELKSILLCDKGAPCGLINVGRWGKIIRADLLIELAQYCTDEISYAEDHQLMIGVFYACRKIKIIDEYKYYYRFNPNSIMNSYIKNMWKQIELLMRTIRKNPYLVGVPDFEKQYNTYFLLRMYICFRYGYKYHFFSKTFYKDVLSNNEIKKALATYYSDKMWPMCKRVCLYAQKQRYLFTYILLMACEVYVTLRRIIFKRV